MYFVCILNVFCMYFTKQCILYVFCMYFICILYVFYVKLEEFVTSIIGYRLSNAHHVLRLLEFMPVDFNLVKRVITSFNNLHYDIDTGILHSLAASRIHELRGSYKLQSINEKDSIVLITLAASIANTNSVLDVILSDYIDIKESRKKGQRTFKHLFEYIMYVLNNENQSSLLEAKVV